MLDDSHAQPDVHHGWLYRRLMLPILALLRMGATPEKLAWSIAVGLLVGINPLLGSTTIVCLVIAGILRLNVAASQLANHIVYPLEVLLAIPFIHLGSRLFHTTQMPLTPAFLLHAIHTHPVALTRQLWSWEWHALVVWAAVAIIGAPLLALTLTPPLRRLLARVEHHQYPILSSSEESDSAAL